MINFIHKIHQQKSSERHSHAALLHCFVGQTVQTQLYSVNDAIKKSKVENPHIGAQSQCFQNLSGTS